MRRTGLLIGGWALATLLALGLGLQSVSAISDSVTSRPRKTLSPASVRAALDRSDSSDESSSSEATESPGSPSESNSSGGTSGSGSSGSSSSSSSSSAAASAPSRSSNDDGSGPSSSDDGSNLSSSSFSDNESSDDGSSSSSQPVSAPHDETYDLIGGTVAVRFENGEAHLLFAAAASGFTMENDSNSSSVDVRFRSDDHESRLRAFWNNGPQHEIEEKD